MEVGLATYLAVAHVGMLATTAVLPLPPTEPAARTRRMIAAAVAYVMAAAAVAAYVATRRQRSGITFWATVLIIFFGLSFAVYSAVPKVPKTTNTTNAASAASAANAGTASEWATAASAVTMGALLAGVVAGIFADRASPST